MNKGSCVTNVSRSLRRLGLWHSIMLQSASSSVGPHEADTRYASCNTWCNTAETLPTFASTSSVLPGRNSDWKLLLKKSLSELTTGKAGGNKLAPGNGNIPKALDLTTTTNLGAFCPRESPMYGRSHRVASLPYAFSDLTEAPYHSVHSDHWQSRGPDCRMLRRCCVLHEQKNVSTTSSLQVCIQKSNLRAATALCIAEIGFIGVSSTRSTTIGLHPYTDYTVYIYVIICFLQCFALSWGRGRTFFHVLSYLRTSKGDLTRLRDMVPVSQVLEQRVYLLQLDHWQSTGHGCSLQLSCSNNQAKVLTVHVFSVS